MVKFDALILDLDDTLYPEIDYVKSGFRAVSDFLADSFEENYPIFNDYLINLFQEGERGKIFDRLIKKFSLEISVEKLVEVYRGHIPNIKCFKDSKEFLKRHSKDCLLILLTDGSTVSQRMKIKSLGLSKYFDGIYITDEFGSEYWKPSLLVYKKILIDFELNAEKLCVIGDNTEKDFITPNNLQKFTIFESCAIFVQF